MRVKINAIILASGFSKRMGRNKLLLPIKGKSIIERIMKEVIKVSFQHTVIVARDEITRKKAEDIGLECIENVNAEKGISESIKLGVLNSPSCEGYMFFVGDQVFLNESLISFLVEVFQSNHNSIIVPLYDGERGNPVIFPGEFKNELLGLQGDKGGRIIIERNISRVKFVNIEDKGLGIDVDTAEEYDKILKK